MHTLKKSVVKLSRPILTELLGSIFAGSRRANHRSRHQDANAVLNRAALDGPPPTFFIAEHDLSRLQTMFHEARTRVCLDFRFFKHHPARTTDVDAADFHVICVMDPADLGRMRRLPQRRHGGPYLCYVRINCDNHLYRMLAPFFRRPDVVFFTYDLGDCVLTSDGKVILSGVTIPSPYQYEGAPRNISPHSRYYFSFQGNCNQFGWYGSSHVRRKLKRLATPADQVTHSYLYVDTTGEHVDTSKQNYMGILRNSTFALIPHGDGRWSHRLAEAIGAGAIPVIIADGLTLPYEQLIDYTHFTVRIPEEAVIRAASMDEISRQLPKDPGQILWMMENVARVHEACFRDQDVRIEMLLRAARQHWLRNTSASA